MTRYGSLSFKHASIEATHGVGGRKPRRRSRFEQEPIARRRPIGQLGERHLDGHAMAEDQVLGGEDGGHSASRDLGLDAVLAVEHVARKREPHGLPDGPGRLDRSRSHGPRERPRSGET